MPNHLPAKAGDNWKLVTIVGSIWWKNPVFRDFFSKCFKIPFTFIPDKKINKLEIKKKQSDNKTLYRVLSLLYLYFVITLLSL